MLEIIEVSVTDEDENTEYKAWDIVVDGKEVGCAEGYTQGDAYIERIDIYEEFRNNGYGTAALRELSDMLGGIMLAPDNEDAKRLYERIGVESHKENADYVDQGYGVYDI